MSDDQKAIRLSTLGTEFGKDVLVVRQCETCGKLSVTVLNEIICPGHFPPAPLRAVPDEEAK